MGYWSSITDPLFKNGSTGERIVYPYGIFPKGIFTFGYIVTPQVEGKIRTFIKHFYLVLIIGGAVMTSTLNAFTHSLPIHILAIFFITLLFIGWYIVRMRQLTRTLSRSLERPSLREAYRAQESSIGVTWAGIIVMISVVFFALAVLVTLEAGVRLELVGAILFALFMLIRSLYLLRGALQVRGK